MKPRHAAALALVGWYLMMPPLYEDEKEPRIDAPLNEWKINMSFDDADSCETVLIHLQNNLGSDRKLAKRKMNSVCVSTDDPRLKPK